MIGLLSTNALSSRWWRAGSSSADSFISIVSVPISSVTSLLSASTLLCLGHLQGVLSLDYVGSGTGDNQEVVCCCCCC